MTPDRALWLLQHPLDYADMDPRELDPYKAHAVQADGAILTAVLAVDR